MDLGREVLVAKWQKLDNPEIMGYEIAYKARKIADFFRGLRPYHTGGYGTQDFDDYIERVVRGCQALEGHDDISVRTTHDLHEIELTSWGIRLVDMYLCGIWADRLEYARVNIKGGR